MPELAGRRAALLDARTRITLIQAPDPRRAAGPIGHWPGGSGDLVSLLPLGADVDGVTTHGLAYPLTDEVLADRSGSWALERPRCADDATVTVASGLLLVVESPATLPA